ncbi:uncharacterized protein METZ01_LOCUS335527, partial [marine metagenome]
MRDSYVFAGNPLDRAEFERRDESWLAKQIRDPQSRFLPMWRLNAPIADDAETRLAWVNGVVLDRLPISPTPRFLGLLDGVPHFAIDISDLEDPINDLMLDGELQFEEARAAATMLISADAG